jgi:hypothetical protein
LAGSDDRHRQAGQRQRRYHQPLPAAGGFHHDQLGSHGLDAADHRGDAGLVVGAPPRPPTGVHRAIQSRLVHVDTDRAGHCVFVPVSLLLGVHVLGVHVLGVHALAPPTTLAVPALHDPRCIAPAMVRVLRDGDATALADPRSRRADPGHSDLARRV